MQKVLLFLLISTAVFATQRWAVEPLGHLDDAKIYDLCIVENDVWCATTSGVKIWNQLNKKFISIDHTTDHLYCQAIGATGRDNVWVATLKNGLYHYNGRQWRSFTSQDGLPSNRVNDVLYNGHQRLWVATDRGLVLYENAQFSSITLPGYDHPSVLGLVKLNSKTILVEIEGGAIFSVNRDGAKEISTADGTFRKSVQSDKNGNIWIAQNPLTKKANMICAGQEHLQMSLPSNLGLVIPFLISSDQSYIIGYKSEILYYQDSDWHTLALPGAHENTRIHVLKQASRNSIWIGAGKCLFRMTRKQNKPAMMSHGLSCKNYPNPFNPETTFNISLPQDGHASFKIYDILGRETETLLNQSTSAGMHRISWNAARYPSGLYYAVLEFAGQRIVQKVLLQK